MSAGQTSTAAAVTTFSAAAKRKKGRSAPAAAGGRRVRFEGLEILEDEDNENEEEDDVSDDDDDDENNDVGVPGGRLSYRPPASAGKRRKTTPTTTPFSSGKKRGRPGSAAAAAAARAAKSRRKKSAKGSNLFSGMTFMLSGMPGKEEVDELTELIELHGGEVRSEVPPPETPIPFTPSPPAGAPMERTLVPGLRTRVITPKPGRTLKCLYAAAVGADIVTPGWVHASLDAGKPLSPASTPPAMLLSRGRAGQSSRRRHRRMLMRDDGDGDSDEDRDDEDEDEDEDSPIMDGDVGGLFNGMVTALSGDARFLREFGVLLRHAGADVVSAEELVGDDGGAMEASAAAGRGGDDDDGGSACDYVVVQGGSRMPASLQRAAKRLAVPCVWHEWVVESLLANSLTAKRVGQYAVK